MTDAIFTGKGIPPCRTSDSPDLFFPEDVEDPVAKNTMTRAAKKICNTCEYKNECLVLALKNDERFGVWGGTTHEDRKRLRRNMIKSKSLRPTRH